MRVAIRVTDQLTSRAAGALAAHPQIEEVGLLGHRPGAGWEHRMRTVPDPQGFDILISSGPQPTFGCKLVVPGGADRAVQAVTHASPVGLARRLASELGGATPAVTRFGKPLTWGRRVPFPSPIGWLRAREETDEVLVAPTELEVAGVVAFTTEEALGVVDDPAYLAAVCLAAGAFVRGFGPVWEDAAYLDAVRELGVVLSSTGL